MFASKIFLFLINLSFLVCIKKTVKIYFDLILKTFIFIPIQGSSRVVTSFGAGVIWHV
jgi:hypothetical protein